MTATTSRYTPRFKSPRRLLFAIVALPVGLLAQETGAELEVRLLRQLAEDSSAVRLTAILEAKAYETPVWTPRPHRLSVPRDRIANTAA
jgi:hypothetical protein